MKLLNKWYYIFYSYFLFLFFIPIYYCDFRSSWMWRISFKNKKMGSFNKVASLCLLLSIVIHNHRGSDAARILGIFPLPAKSHSVMTEALMRGLAARGHQVDVLTPFPVKNPPPNYRDISLAGVVPVMTNNLTLTEAEKFTSGTLRQMIYMAGYSMCKILDSPLIRDIIENPPTDPPYDLVIYEVSNIIFHILFWIY